MGRSYVIPSASLSSRAQACHPGRSPVIPSAAEGSYKIPQETGLLRKYFFWCLALIYSLHLIKAPYLFIIFGYGSVA